MRIAHMTDPRSLILEHALPLVPFDGWSDHTLAQAASRAKMGAAELRRAFPAGIADCIDYFFAQEDEALAEAFPQSTLAKVRVPDRIEMLILAQLEGLIRHKEAVRSAVAHNALPWNAPRAIRSLYRSVDRMWQLAGDNATDFNFYTKRATLAALYSSTLLYWLNDTSQDMEATKAFLKRGLAGIAVFGKKKAELRKKFVA